MRYKDYLRMVGDICIKPVVHLHRYKYLWSKCCKTETIIAAWKKLRKGKTKRREVRHIEKHFDYYIEQMQNMLYETRPDGDPYAMFTPRRLRPRHIHEHGKDRLIYCPPIWDQWFHHIVILVVSPIITKHSYAYTCGSMPKRGGVYGKHKLSKIIARGGFKYFAKLDIRHFFNHVGIKHVVKKLNMLIEDDWFIFLIERIFIQFNDILPLGLYPSQWFANFILSPIDWFIARKKPICYIRYVDDFVIGSDNKKFLHGLIKDIKKELGKLRLKLKKNYQVIRFDFIKGRRRIGRGIDFMGFYFFRDRIILRRSLLYRTVRFVKRLGNLTNISRGQAHSMLSRMGWFKHTDTRYIWRKMIRPYISVAALKEIVRKHTRRINHGQSKIILV